MASRFGQFRDVKWFGPSLAAIFAGCAGSTAFPSTTPHVQQHIIDVLRGCALFSAVESAGLQRLATMAQLRTFRKGQMVFREDTPCPGVYVVGQGMVRLFKSGPGGKEHVLHMIGPGGSFAEVAAIGNFPLPAFTWTRSRRPSNFFADGESARGRSARIAGFAFGKRLNWPIVYLAEASERLWIDGRADAH